MPITNFLTIVCLCAITAVVDCYGDLPPFIMAIFTLGQVLLSMAIIGQSSGRS